MARAVAVDQRPDAASPVDAVLADEDDLAGLDGEPGRDMISANPMMIGPMPLQQQANTSLPAAETSAAMAQMALEDEAVMAHQHKRAVLNNPTSAPYPSGVQSQMAALSSSSPQTMKLADKHQSHGDSIDDMPTGELDIDASQLRSDGRPDGRPVIRPATYQQNISQASIANSKYANGSDQALIDVDGDVQFDSADDFMRAATGQTERGVGGISGQSVSVESPSANAVQMQVGGLAVGGQMSQQNNGQSGGKSGGSLSKCGHDKW